MRTALRGLVVALAVAAPLAMTAAPANAALVCVYWGSVKVYDGPPGGDVYAPTVTGADLNCTVQAIGEIVPDVEIDQ